MAYEQVQKPSSSFVPVQKKVSEFAPSASRVQAKDVTAGEQEQIALGSTPATDANWLMKHPLFKGNQFLQRVVAPASESESLESEEETLQRQEEGNESATPYSLPVQAKLTIGEPGDKYEQEADRVASQVVKQINSPEAAQSTQGQSVQRREEPVEELQRQPSISDLQRSPLPLEVQREAMPEEEDLQAKSILQRREAIGGGEATNDLDTAINSARGGGQSLDAGLQQSMGQAMGADFSGVKVHTDAQSDQLNQSIQAKAFTTGQDVFFRQGAYDPGSRGGQELIAHELTHVVQQNGGAVQRSPLPPLPFQEADVMGAKVLQQKVLSTNGGMAVQKYQVNGTTIIQRVVKFDRDPVKSFQSLSDYVDIQTVENRIIFNLGHFISQIELDNAVRSLDLELESSREQKQIEDNQEKIINGLTKEIFANSRGRIAAGKTLSEIIPDKKVVQLIHQQLGSCEVERLSGLILLIWESGQISVDKLIKILQEPEITHHTERRGDFQNLLVELSDHPLAMKMLGQKSVEDILALLKDSNEKETFLEHAKTVKEAANQNELDPLKIVEIDKEERFLDQGNAIENLNHDLSIVKKDLDYNLQEDLSYMADLEKRYNKSAPEPDNPSSDSERLKSELARMRKIYTYKINYISILKRFQDLDNNLIQTIDTLKKQGKAEVASLQKSHDEVFDPTFRNRATRGYMMRKTRDAENARRTIENNMARSQLKFDQKKEDVTKKAEKEKKHLIKKASEFLNINKNFISLLQAKIMLLPSDMRMAGIFPKDQSVRITKKNKDQRHSILQKHAQKLLMDHGLFMGETSKRGKPSKGILPASRTGCVCIMYIKEGHTSDEGGATFRPVFGASGVEPYRENQKTISEEDPVANSYVNMGLPKPQQKRLGYGNAVGNLKEHTHSMKRLGIKPPSMQSQLYFLQTPEYHSNLIVKGLMNVDTETLAEAQKNLIGMLENWMPSNCAEPAIITAIYQLYNQPKDIYLSVPFEGELHNGKLLLKYTCTRCAVSEPAFLSPTKQESHRLTDMRLQEATHGLVNEKLESEELVYNATNPNHPYIDKKHSILRTMWRNQGEGFAHVKPKRKNEDSAKKTIEMIKTIDILISGLIEAVIKQVPQGNTEKSDL
jgi:hypothetical protein